MISDISIGDSNALLRIIIIYKNVKLLLDLINKIGKFQIIIFFKNFAINLNAYNKNK